MKRILLTIALAGAMVLGVNAARDKEELTPHQKLAIAERIIENFYVEEVDADSLVDEAIRAMLRILDPHSAYTTADETREFTQPLEGSFSGIGVQFNMARDTVYVIQPTPGGPSEKVGIRPGDRIVAANDTIIAGKKLSNAQVMKILRGPKGSKVKLSVRRAGVPELIDFMVTRDDIPNRSIDAVYMADPTTGYISIMRFAESTGHEFAEALEQLKAQGMKNLIIDLANNGGGLLGSAFDVAQQLLPAGSPVVWTSGLNTRPSHFETEAPGTFTDGRVVVIANQYSASASEILAGAIQDNDRGLVVGRRTFGKGLVQRPFPFADGSMMRLTTQRYYTPSGRCIQKPYSKGHTEEYQLDMLNRYSSGELWSADSIHIADSTEYRTLHNNRRVYGGGGIIPDRFVPVDTSYLSTYYRDLVAKGSIAQYCLGVVDRDRAALLAQYPTEDAFHARFEVTQDMIQGLMAQGEADGVEPNEEQLNVSRPLIEAIIKGLLARDLYENGVYVRATNPLNHDFVEAIRLINAPDEYNQLLGVPQPARRRR